jgi:hypothetical protein
MAAISQAGYSRSPSDLLSQLFLSATDLFSVRDYSDPLVRVPCSAIEIDLTRGDIPNTLEGTKPAARAGAEQA